MEKILLRKDYKIRVVPVEEAVGHYLAKRVERVWTEDFLLIQMFTTLKTDLIMECIKTKCLSYGHTM